MTFTDNHNGTATIAGTPTATTDTNYPITIKASNGISPDATQSFTLKVTTVPAVALPASKPSANGTLGGVPSKVYVNQVLTVTGSGYKPGAPIEIGWYYSSSGKVTKMTVLAHGFANASGSFSIPVTVANNTGAKTVMSAGMGTNGKARYLSADTVVNPPLAASAGLLAGVPLATTAGKTLTVSGAGYTAGTSIEIGWYLPQSVVGHAVADSAGKFRFTLTVPSDGCGARVAYAVGLGSNGKTRYLLAPTVVTKPGRGGSSGTGGTSTGGTSTGGSSTGGGLANTGLSSQRISVASGGALALTGFALMLIGRRRRDEQK
ncbi:MAG: hypothetical protein JO144_15960 [Actinobacteria bacterium]|nr:hypothetical protein [Actinomycetota bacterium]